jgi:hypothetical protein
MEILPPLENYKYSQKCQEENKSYMKFLTIINILKSSWYSIFYAYLFITYSLGC